MRPLPIPIDDEPVLLKCQIKRPDHVIVLDLSLVTFDEIKKELKPGGQILINSREGIDFFQPLREFTVGLIDAASIAREAGLGGTFNTAILGAYVRLTGLVGIETLVEAVRAMAPAKKDANVRAVLEAYDKTVMYRAG